MEVLESVEVLFAFTLIAFIDMPKIKATANRKKYSIIYYAVVAAGLLIGVLEIFQIIPDYDKNLSFFFQKITGIK
jgi:hypothetical protein